MRTETQEQFKHSNAYVVWLTASPAVILERLNADLKTAATRPPLTSLPVADEILSLLEKRLPVYRGLCDLEISTDVISPEEIVRQIKREIDTAGG